MQTVIPENGETIDKSEFGVVTVELKQKIVQPELKIIAYLLNVSKRVTFSLSNIMAKKEKPKPRECVMFQTTDWDNDHPAPNNIRTFIHLLHLAQKWNSRTETNDPILVISRDGVLRSGPFCVASICLNRLMHETEVDVFRAVESVKRNRPQLLSTLQEYQYCYTCAAEMAVMIRERLIKLPKLPETPSSSILQLDMDALGQEEDEEDYCLSFDEDEVVQKLRQLPQIPANYANYIPNGTLSQSLFEAAPRTKKRSLPVPRYLTDYTTDPVDQPAAAVAVPLSANHTFQTKDFLNNDMHTPSMMSSQRPSISAASAAAIKPGPNKLLNLPGSDLLNQIVGTSSKFFSTGGKSFFSNIMTTKPSTEAGQLSNEAPSSTADNYFVNTRISNKSTTRMSGESGCYA
ncbi:hypothetical protein Ciccas_009766 [Cichlidogyrus casuarinus]|uniref:Tyrosine-protein phosphatase domain-containing protein n=1 Tax=Cichlidogyrus casuarinus TaxID=1844966 RepID=A0ABD2PYW2_9PLAT